jgi:hypothetical protein
MENTPAYRQVYKYMPILPDEPEGGMDELGVNVMQPLANQRVVIGCLEVFKMFLKVKRFGMPKLCLWY